MKVLIVCDRRFNDYQMWTTVKILKAHSVAFDFLSTAYVIREEGRGRQFTIEYTFANVPDLDQYDGLMLISGWPDDTKEYWTHKGLEKIVLAFKDKKVAAICASTASIRYIARGKRVTGFPLQKARQLLQLAGAIIDPVPVVHDQGLVTADNEWAASTWAETFVQVLKGREPILNYQAMSETRKLSERKPIKEFERMKGNK